MGRERWVIVGGGIHGVHLAVRLLEQGVRPDRLHIVDPADGLLDGWRRRTRATGMRFLRSPAVHHLDVDPWSLLAFAGGDGRGREVDEGLFTPPYNRPSLALFEAHCDRVVAKYDLWARHLRDRVVRLSPGEDAVDVALGSGTGLRADRVILAMGSAQTPVWPDWAKRLNGAPVQHVYAPGFELKPEEWPGRVGVIGAGITGGQVALRLAAAGRQVHLVARHGLREQQFDADPGWVGPKFMRRFDATPCLRERRTLIAGARHKGSMPPDLHAQVCEAIDQGSIVLHRAEATAHTCDEGLHLELTAEGQPSERIELSGFLGAGKTTFLNHVLANREGLRVAVIVNDMSEVNIDAAWVRDGDASLSRTDERLVEMSNGCICCTLREDLLAEVAALANEGRFDYLLIESTGVSEPLPVAQTFTFEAEDGTSLSSVARLDTMVTVVDAQAFPAELARSVSLASRGLAINEDDERTLPTLHTEQVEFADVVIINKVDLVTAAELHKVEATVRAINPDAAIVHSERGRVELDTILGTGRFDMDAAQERPAWVQELEAWLRSRWKGVVRAKGWFWVASRPNHTAFFQLAGGTRETGVAGLWWAAVPPERRPGDPDWERRMEALWHPSYGDRRQEIVVIGVDLDETALRANFDACLLTEAELEQADQWAELPHPFPWPQA